MEKAVRIQSLGVPSLTSSEGGPIAVKTRKALAILIFLLRTPGQKMPRETLADVFWSDAPREKATQSLRQALRQLRSIEPIAGQEILETGNLYVSVRDDALELDLTRLTDLLARGSAQDFKAAESLWKGEFLLGFEALDPEFTDWLSIERERINSELISRTFRIIDGLSAVDDGDQIEAAARFLLHVDPALESAHQVLIRLYIARNQRERAIEQLKVCERELRSSLDAEPDAETLRLLEGEGRGAVGETRLTPAGLNTRPPDLDDGGIRLPEISVLSLSLNNSTDAMARTLRDEITAGLSSYRSFDLRQAEYQSDASASSVVRADGGELGSYLLRFREDAGSSRVFIQFEDRDSGRIVFNEIIDLETCRDSTLVHSSAFQTVSRIHAYVLGRLRKPIAKSPFARWCQAEALLWEFSPMSDEKALSILNDLEVSHGTFSMTYAGMASINMKRLLYYPDHISSPRQLVDDILMVAEKGVNLDPWQSFNQRIYGWALVQSGLAEDAQRAFKQAERLSPIDPSNLMSVAEGLAFAGDIELSRKIADRAFSLFAVVPRIVYEYLANVHFAAEDYAAAEQFTQRAPVGSMFGLTTRVASLICTGREAEAVEVLKTFGSRFDGIVERKGLEDPDQLPWYQRINFFQDQKTKANYKRGADLIQRYLSGNL
jgi:DNA-binding SARP family transcriptional activator